MVCEWRTRSLGELTENYDSIRVPVKETDRRSGPYPYYGASGIVDYVDGYLFDGEYLLIAEDGENLRTRTTPIAFLARGKFWVNNHAHVVKGNGEADTRFLMYALAARDISGYLTGSTIPKLSQRALNQITLLTPPIDEQRAIAHILGTLDDKIELNRRMNATLEAIARAIFKSWFVDFDPVHAKARGEQPYGMDAETAALFPDAFEDSELGPIPAGWRVTTLSKTVEVVKGRSYKSSEIEQSNVALVTLKSINRGGGYNPQGLKPYTGKYRPEQIVSPGEIVVAFTDITQQAEVIGKPALVRGHPDYDSLIASLDLGIVRPMIVGMNIPYLYELLSTDGFQAHVLSYVNGSTVLHLNNRGIPSYRYPLPTPAVLAKFEALAQPLFDRISANEAESRTLAELRDTLLPKLILGDIRIGECNDATSS